MKVTTQYFSDEVCGCGLKIVIRKFARIFKRTVVRKTVWLIGITCVHTGCNYELSCTIRITFYKAEMNKFHRKIGTQISARKSETIVERIDKSPFHVGHDFFMIVIKFLHTDLVFLSISASAFSYLFSCL